MRYFNFRKACWNIESSTPDEKYYLLLNFIYK